MIGLEQIIDMCSLSAFLCSHYILIYFFLALPLPAAGTYLLSHHPLTVLPNKTNLLENGFKIYSNGLYKIHLFSFFPDIISLPYPHIIIKKTCLHLFINCQKHLSIAIGCIKM